jgi:hypothetical protein
VEISLGLHKLWMSLANSPWVHFRTVEQVPSNNYALVTTFAEQLLGPAPGTPTWAPVATRRTMRGEVLRVLHNPHSSKPVPFDAQRWVELFSQVARRCNERQLEVTILPGLDKASRGDSLAIVHALSRSGISARLLGSQRRETTPYNTIASIVSALHRFDMCVTIDTFTAHLAPLFGVPTIVLALKQNPQFWVPARHAIYLTPDAIDRDFAPLFARLSGDSKVSPARRSAAIALDRALNRACGHTDIHGLQGIYRALINYLATVDDRSAWADGVRWLRFWSRAQGALQREPVSSELLAPYLRVFTDSAFCKLALFDN